MTDGTPFRRKDRWGGRQEENGDEAAHDHRNLERRRLADGALASERRWTEDEKNEGERAAYSFHARWTGSVWEILRGS
jgi:hypothetical protein